MRILLVEDNELNRDMLSRRLARRGFTVTCAVDGEGAVRGAAHDSPDVILMDISLPGFDGWEAIARIKASPDTAAIPVVALTAHVSSADQDRARALGFSDFIRKPIDFETLLAAIRRHAQRAERE